MAQGITFSALFVSCALLISGQPTPVKEFQELPKDHESGFSFSKCPPACSGRNVYGFSAPKTWLTIPAISQGAGQWMTDPTRSCGADIFFSRNYRTEDLEVYSSTADISTGNRQRQITIPGYMAGTGAVVWNNSLYYSLANNRSIGRLDLTTGQLVVSRELPSTASHNNGGGQYQWGGYTDVDLAVSETGIYMIYASTTDLQPLVVSRINPITLEYEFAYVTTKTKRWYGDCFVICATLYCTGSYNQPQTSTTFVYDIVRRQEVSRPLPFANARGHNSQISYNPTDRKLYSVTAGSLVTYDVHFS